MTLKNGSLCGAHLEDPKQELKGPQPSCIQGSTAASDVVHLVPLKRVLLMPYLSPFHLLPLLVRLAGATPLPCNDSLWQRPLDACMQAAPSRSTISAGKASVG
jgi:hypothetical protein